MCASRSARISAYDRGLPRAKPGLINTIPPGYFGGNIDNWRIGKGATLYLPVSVYGALFSVGDSHASQGDSELRGTAIECSLTGLFQLIVRKKGETLAGTALEGLDYPLLETKDEWIVHGFTYANYLDALGAKRPGRHLREILRRPGAMRDAFRKMRRFLMTTKGLTEDEAISLMSVGVDFGISQVVDGNFGVHAILRKGHLPPDGEGRPASAKRGGDRRAGGGRPPGGSNSNPSTFQRTKRRIAGAPSTVLRMVPFPPSLRDGGESAAHLTTRAHPPPAAPPSGGNASCARASDGRLPLRECLPQLSGRRP